MNLSRTGVFGSALVFDCHVNYNNILPEVKRDDCGKRPHQQPIRSKTRRMGVRKWAPRVDNSIKPSPIHTHDAFRKRIQAAGAETSDLNQTPKIKQAKHRATLRSSILSAFIMRKASQEASAAMSQHGSKQLPSSSSGNFVNLYGDCLKAAASQVTKMQ